MNTLEKWSLQNKRTRGSSNINNLFKDSENTIFNIGTDEIKSDSLIDKNEYFEKLKEQITKEDILKIEELITQSRHLHSLMKKLEEVNIPLDYLIILKKCQEEDLQIYLSLKNKGFNLGDLSHYTRDDYIDDDYIRKVMNNSKDLPELKNIHGQKIDKGLDNMVNEKEIRLENVNLNRQLEDALKEIDELKQQVNMQSMNTNTQDNQESIKSINSDTLEDMSITEYIEILKGNNTSDESNKTNAKNNTLQVFVYGLKDKEIEEADSDLDIIKIENAEYLSEVSSDITNTIIMGDEIKSEKEFISIKHFFNNLSFTKFQPKLFKLKDSVISSSAFLEDAELTIKSIKSLNEKYTKDSLRNTVSKDINKIT